MSHYYRLFDEDSRKRDDYRQIAVFTHLNGQYLSDERFEEMNVVRGDLREL